MLCMQLGVGPGGGTLPEEHGERVCTGPPQGPGKSTVPSAAACPGPAGLRGWGEHLQVRIKQGLPVQPQDTLRHCLAT